MGARATARNARAEARRVCEARSTGDRIDDSRARYSSFYRTLASKPPAPTVWEGDDVEKVVAALGAPLAAAERERRTRERDRRLLALRRHKIASSNSE